MPGPTLPLASGLTSARPSAHRTASGLGLPASLGPTLTLALPLRGPSQGAWRRNAGDWGPPSPCAGLNLPPRHHPGCNGRRWSFRAGEQAGPSDPPAIFEGNLRQNAWAHTPAHQRPHLSPPLRSPHSWRIGPNRLLGDNPNPRSAPEGISQGVWLPNTGDWDPPSPSSGLTRLLRCHQAARGAADHSGWQNGQALPSPR